MTTTEEKHLEGVTLYLVNLTRFLHTKSERYKEVDGKRILKFLEILTFLKVSPHTILLIKETKSSTKISDIVLEYRLPSGDLLYFEVFKNDTYNFFKFVDRKYTKTEYTDVDEIIDKINFFTKELQHIPPTNPKVIYDVVVDEIKMSEETIRVYS